MYESCWSPVADQVSTPAVAPTFTWRGILHHAPSITAMISMQSSFWSRVVSDVGQQWARYGRAACCFFTVAGPGINCARNRWFFRRVLAKHGQAGV